MDFEKLYGAFSDLGVDEEGHAALLLGKAAGRAVAKVAVVVFAFASSYKEEIEKIDQALKPADEIESDEDEDEDFSDLDPNDVW